MPCNNDRFLYIYDLDWKLGDFPIPIPEGGADVRGSYSPASAAKLGDTSKSEFK